MNHPNLFIVGAPKCGTTAMYEYLKQHPDIFFSPVKEPCFFGVDLHYKQRLNKSSYLSLFDASDKFKYYGEASPMYLMSKKAAKEIKNFSSHAKIIIMLRKPVEMVYARYLQNLYNGVESIDSFEKAWEVSKNREKKNTKVTSSGQPIERLYYTECAKYHMQVENYYEQFGKDNVHIVLFDDFKEDTEKAYNKVLEFLNVSPKSLVKYEKINPAKANHNNTLHRFLKYPPSWLRSIVRLFLPKKITTNIYQSLRSINQKTIKKQDLPISLKNEIIGVYKDDVNSLSKLLKRDLSHWNKP